MCVRERFNASDYSRRGLGGGSTVVGEHCRHGGWHSCLRELLHTLRRDVVSVNKRFASQLSSASPVRTASCKRTTARVMFLDWSGTQTTRTTTAWASWPRGVLFPQVYMQTVMKVKREIVLKCGWHSFEYFRRCLSWSRKYSSEHDPKMHYGITFETLCTPGKH